jgi:hypothetical protein
MIDLQDIQKLIRNRPPLSNGVLKSAKHSLIVSNFVGDIPIMMSPPKKYLRIPPCYKLKPLKPPNISNVTYTGVSKKAWGEPESPKSHWFSMVFHHIFTMKGVKSPGHRHRHLRPFTWTTALDIRRDAGRGMEGAP